MTPIAPNLLARNFTVARANTFWVGDVTYIPTGEGWLYLAVVLDLFSRRIVGWAMGEAITAELASRARHGVVQPVARTWSDLP
jgi:transposase InsO family protein